LLGFRQNFRNSELIPPDWVGMVLIRNCKRHSNPQPLALTSRYTPDNRKNISTRLSAFFLRPDVHIAGK
jgi:hypothetical protein